MRENQDCRVRFQRALFEAVAGCWPMPMDTGLENNDVGYNDARYLVVTLVLADGLRLAGHPFPMACLEGCADGGGCMGEG